MTSIADGSRRENDAEHSWSLAIMAFLFVDMWIKSLTFKSDKDGVNSI